MIEGQKLLLKHCSLPKFHATDGQNKSMIRLRVIEGRNMSDQGVFYAFHTFLVEVQTNTG